MTPTAKNLLSLLAIRDIPANLCDLRPKMELKRRGYAEYLNELTNTLSEKGSVVYVRRVLHITEKGRTALALLETAK